MCILNRIETETALQPAGNGRPSCASERSNRPSGWTTLMLPLRWRYWLRCASWTCLPLIAYLSLVPAAMEIRTPAPAGIEHAVAYAGTTLLFAFAYPSISAWRLFWPLAMYSVAMEVLQNYSPGRHPGVDGVLWSSAGVLISAVVVASLPQRVRY